jgi:hypothetical protein
MGRFITNLATQSPLLVLVVSWVVPTLLSQLNYFMPHNSAITMTMLRLISAALLLFSVAAAPRNLQRRLLDGEDYDWSLCECPCGETEGSVGLWFIDESPFYDEDAEITDYDEDDHHWYSFGCALQVDADSLIVEDSISPGDRFVWCDYSCYSDDDDKDEQ